MAAPVYQPHKFVPRLELVLPAKGNENLSGKTSPAEKSNPMKVGKALKKGK